MAFAITATAITVVAIFVVSAVVVHCAQIASLSDELKRANGRIDLGERMQKWHRDDATRWGQSVRRCRVVLDAHQERLNALEAKGAKRTYLDVLDGDGPQD